MIVLAGIPSEPPLQMVRQAADAAGIETVLLNQREAGVTDLRLEMRGGKIHMFLHRAGTVTDLTRARGIYTRMGSYEVLPEYKYAPQADQQHRIRAWHQLFSDWSETTPVRMLNRLKACNANMSKPYQARLIRACGLDTPKTLITNDPEAALAFRAEQGQVIFKSISAHRSIVRRLEGAHLRNLDRIRVLPVQFQELVPGTDIRVHVIGDAVFATEIDSSADDYRYAASEEKEAVYRETDLPGPIRAACLRLSKRSNLPLCGIDLRRAPDGRFVCFEINPSPAYSCYEERTGQPIAAAIAGWLETGDARAVGRIDSLSCVS